MVYGAFVFIYRRMYTYLFFNKIIFICLFIYFVVVMYILSFSFDIFAQTTVTLQQLQQVQLMARQQKWYDNIAATLLGVNRTRNASSAQAPSEDELVEALEEKYDALKDKLLAESLMKQMGAADWAALSERERQAKLVKLKLQEKKLREEGKLDEASRLV
jgi:hypothetical protein